MIRIAIVEDDPAEGDHLQREAERCCSALGQSAEVTRFYDGLELSEDYRPVWDIIFMDIELPHQDGMETARCIRRRDSAAVLIFITHMARYAIHGYEVDAMDFLVKPVSGAQLELKLKKALRRVEQQRKELYFMVHQDGEKLRVSTRDVLYIEVINHRLLIHTEDRRYELSGTLRDMEKELSAVSFFRCSNSFLVNLRNVSAVRRETLVVGGQELPVSRPNRKELLLRLADVLGGGLR